MKVGQFIGGMLSAALLGVSCVANAAPMTLYFTGTFSQFINYAGDLVEEATGQPFSGYITYDISLAEFGSGNEDPRGITSADATTQSGCMYSAFGTCSSDYGSDAPLVIDYRVTWSGGTYGPLAVAAELPIYDVSSLYLKSQGPPLYDINEVWNIFRSRGSTSIRATSLASIPRR